jgi:predicted HAD superfamily Cof-like phosphohydrolase
MAITKDFELEDVKAFHQKFNLGHPHTEPGHLTPRKLQERIAFLQEELDELKKAAASNDLAAQADALIDLVYVAKGTASLMGLPWELMWLEVHRANMSKERGIGPRGNALDVVKPKHWQGPKHDLILRQNGYLEVAWLHPDGTLKSGVARGDPGECTCRYTQPVSSCHHDPHCPCAVKPLQVP